MAACKGAGVIVYVALRKSEGVINPPKRACLAACRFRQGAGFHAAMQHRMTTEGSVSQRMCVKGVSRRGVVYANASMQGLQVTCKPA